jgi:hypothetical protein
VNLTYPYRSTSTLPRRTFLVNASVRPVGSSRWEPAAVEVTAPDPVAAETVYRVALSKDPRVASYRFDLVREVDTAYSPETGRYTAPVVRVPDTFRHVLTVNHR